MQTPFNLRAGEAVWCKIRGYNKNGTGEWSVENEGYELQGCGKGTATNHAVVLESPQSCKCTRAGKMTGRASCCKSQDMVWSEHKSFNANWIEKNG